MRDAILGPYFATTPWMTAGAPFYADVFPLQRSKGPRRSTARYGSPRWTPEGKNPRNVKPLYRIKITPKCGGSGGK